MDMTGVYLMTQGKWRGGRVSKDNICTRHNRMHTASWA